MRTTELFLDLHDSRVVHASVTCEHNHALLDAAAGEASGLGDLDELLETAEALGCVIPAWSARGLQYCEHCTLVATNAWAIAA